MDILDVLCVFVETGSCYTARAGVKPQPPEAGVVGVVLEMRLSPAGPLCKGQQKSKKHAGETGTAEAEMHFRN